MTTKTFRYGGASVNLVDHGDKGFILANLWSESRERGEAKNVIQQLVDYADKNNITVFLKAQQYGNHRRAGSLSNRELTSLYEKFGFEKFGKQPGIMRRVPSQKLHSI